MPKEKRKAVFFDRDGVIFHPVYKEEGNAAYKEKGKTRAPYSIAEFLKAGGVVDGAEGVLRLLRAKGFLTILVTNQPDIVYGHLSRQEWERIHAHARILPFDDEFICFHGRDDGCECKKPKPGMLLGAAKKWNINLTQSFFVGDTESDTGAARTAGCKSILIDTKYNKEVHSDARVTNLQGVLEIIK